MTQYILNESGEPEICDDIERWAKWMHDEKNRIVEQTKVGPFLVSTVFLGIDHNFGQFPSPVLWETMVFLNEPTGVAEVDDFGGNQQRYHSAIEAEIGHEYVVKMAGIYASKCESVGESKELPPRPKEEK